MSELILMAAYVGLYMLGMVTMYSVMDIYNRATGMGLRGVSMSVLAVVWPLWAVGYLIKGLPEKVRSSLDV